MPKRATLLIVRPRCGLGNSMRVMVSAMHTAQERGLQLAHLWRQDAPIGCPVLSEDERNGARACDFETLFQPIPLCLPFVNRGQTVRLLYEEQNAFFHREINIIDEVSHPCLKFQHHGPLTEDHLENVDAVLVLTSLNFPVSPERKVQLYQSHFTPQTHYSDALETKSDLLSGRWLCVHLRTKVRTAFKIPEWNLAELVQETRRVVRLIPFERIIVFSDPIEARLAFTRQHFDPVPVSVLDWGCESSVNAMFLDFLAISKAALVLSSGVSSFSYEASLFGGGVPYLDMYRGLLLPNRPDPGFA